MDRHKIFVVGVCAIVLAGCHSKVAPTFPDYVGDAEKSFEPPSQTESVFQDYVKAASEAESEGHHYLQMVSFYPGQRMAAMRASTSAVEDVERATEGKCIFDFKPIGPFEAPPHEQGWRLIGRDLVWKIQDGIKDKRFDDVVRATVVATKFGFDISGGGATDASLGLAIADEARKAVAPALNSLNPQQLGELATGVEGALNAKPSLTTVIDHERLNLLECVQTVQNDYRDNRFDELASNLGPDSRGAIEILKDLKHKDTNKRPAYFDGFDGEAEMLVKWMKSVAEIPAVDRLMKPEPQFSSERPWKKFSKEFFSGLKPLLQMNDQTVARTRLLVLEALILEQVQSGNPAPKSLSQFPDNLKTDPYSGKPFVYGAEGSDFHVYSVGADFRDDGGETDETYTQPDLKLERDE
jgi:hypothetical protein